MPGVPGIRLEPVSIEVSGSAVSIVLTQGAINIWFGKKFDKSLIAKILLIISKVDSTTEHEKEVLCRFEEISEFESNGYILTSYARKKDQISSHIRGSILQFPGSGDVHGIYRPGDRERGCEDHALLEGGQGEDEYNQERSWAGSVASASSMWFIRMSRIRISRIGMGRRENEMRGESHEICKLHRKY